MPEVRPAKLERFAILFAEKLCRLLAKRIPLPLSNLNFDIRSKSPWLSEEEDLATGAEGGDALVHDGKDGQVFLQVDFRPLELCILISSGSPYPCQSYDVAFGLLTVRPSCHQQEG